VTTENSLSAGIFWVITDDYGIDGYTLLCFNYRCDADGNNLESVELNSKNGLTFNHKNTWETYVKNNSKHRGYNKKPFDHYPRGRVQITNNKAEVYLNPHIIRDDIIGEIKRRFGLCGVSKVRVIADNSTHYQCFLDRE